MPLPMDASFGAATDKLHFQIADSKPPTSFVSENHSPRLLPCMAPIPLFDRSMDPIEHAMTLYGDFGAWTDLSLEQGRALV